MAFKLGVALISLFIGSLASPLQTPNDLSPFFIHNEASARIVGGSPAPEGSVPYMVAMSQGLLVRSFMCGGSIISSRYVMTAAHCIEAVYRFGSLSKTLRVTVGTNRLNLGGQTYSLARNITHPHFVEDNIIKNDIGLLVTTTDIVFSSLVVPVALSFEEVGGGVAVRVAGWGQIGVGGAVSTELLEIFTETIEGQHCVEEMEKHAIEYEQEHGVNNVPPVYPELELCTLNHPGHGTCGGDSGSALVRTDNQQQIGIVSWSISCAIGAPDIFVRISAFKDWIIANTAETTLLR